jgi:hypothetical protein
MKLPVDLQRLELPVKIPGLSPRRLAADRARVGTVNRER